MTLKIKLLASFIALGVFAVLWGVASVTLATTPPVEMQTACYQNSDGKLSYLATGQQCPGNETQITISAANPTLACATGVEKKVFRVTSAGQCANPSILLTLPNVNGPVYFCSKNSNKDLRYVLNPGECKNNETSVVVSKANQAPTDIALSNNTVAENQASGTTVGTFTTTDPDPGDTHTYGLVSGAGDTDNASFQITGSTLKTAASFNFEAKSSYSIRVQTNDGNGGIFEKQFTITVTNVNEAPTDIALSNDTVAENQPSGTTVGTFSSTDPDAGGSHSYSLVAGMGDADNASFQVAGSTLQTNASFDFEAKSSYAIRVRSTDQGGLTTEKQFTISVTNVNETPTDISLSSNNVDEDQPAGTTVGNFSTTDPDAGDSHTYTFATGTGDTDNASFQITGSTLKTNAVFHWASKSSYTIRVRSTDAGGLFTEKQFTITVNHLNHSPTDISLSNSSVAENQPSGTTVGTFSTTDPDPGDTHSYSLVAGAGDADNASFQITGSTLSTTASFDFETKSSYAIRVRTDDGNGSTFEKQFTISVTNVNETPTNISLSNNSVDENEPAGTAVGNFSTTDPDAGGSHTYTLVAGTGSADNGSFTVVGDELRTNAAFNFEAKSSYSIRVRSTDQGGLFTEKAFTVTVTDVNEAPTNISLSNSSVDENQPAGTAVGDFSTTDPDAGNTHSYTLVAGTGDADNASFQIASNHLQTAAVFNYATKSSYLIRVRSTDQGGLFFEKQFTITITRVDQAPVNSVPGPQSVDEDTDLVFSTANGNAISISDPDAGASDVKVSLEVFSGTLTYQTTTGLTFVDGTSNGQSSVNVTGSIANINAALNGLRYMPNQNFNSTRGNEVLTIVTNDQDSGSGGPLIDSDSVAITVDAVNDKPVATVKGFAAHTNMQISLGGLLAGASDPADAADAGYTPSFTLVDVVVDNCTGCTVSNVDTANGTFDFNPSPGGTGSYTLKYRIADSGNPAPGANSDYTTINITVSGPVIWFVNPNAATNGNGTLTSPFNNLASADAVDAANHRIFVHSGTTTTGIALNSGEWLIGQGVSGASFDSVFGVTPPSGTAARPSVGGTRPVVGGQVVMAANSAVRGLNIQPAASTQGLSASGVTGLTVGEVSVTTSGAAAVNLTNSDGALSFTAVSASGGTNGLVWDNASPATGSLTVTGSGAAGSGGTIQNVTGHGVLLDNARSVSLSWMNISNTGHNGVDGARVVGFSFLNGAINNVGTAAGGTSEESGIAFNDALSSNESNVSGVVTISDSTISNARRHAIDLTNGSGTISNLTISGNTLTSATTSPVSLGSADAIHVAAGGSSTTLAHITTGAITNNVITNFPAGSGIVVTGGNVANTASSTLGAAGTPISITGNRISGASIATRMGQNAIQVAFNGCTGQSNFTVSNNGTAANPLTNFAGVGISLFFAGDVTAAATVDNNVLVSNNTAGSSGIAAQLDGQVLAPCNTPGSGTASVTITNNQVSNNSGIGIRGISINSNGTLNLKVQNNVVATPLSAGRQGIRVDSGNGTANPTVCLNISGNTSAGNSPPTTLGIGLRKQGTMANVNTFGIHGLSPSPATGPQTVTYVNGQNPAGGGTNVISGSNFVACSLP